MLSARAAAGRPLPTRALRACSRALVLPMSKQGQRVGALALAGGGGIYGGGGGGGIEASSAWVGGGCGSEQRRPETMLIEPLSAACACQQACDLWATDPLECGAANEHAALEVGGAPRAGPGTGVGCCLVLPGVTLVFHRVPCAIPAPNQMFAALPCPSMAEEPLAAKVRAWHACSAGRGASPHAQHAVLALCGQERWVRGAH